MRKQKLNKQKVLEQVTEADDGWLRLAAHLAGLKAGLIDEGVLPTKDSPKGRLLVYLQKASDQAWKIAAIHTSHYHTPIK